MSLIYAITTPLGVAIGIGIRSNYQSNSSEALIAQGIFDAMSSGILIYTALVELITPEITLSNRFREQSRYRKIFQYLALYAGVSVMAILGRWA